MNSKLQLVKFVLFLLVLSAVTATAVDEASLDFSQLQYDPILVELISTYIPPAIETELANSGLVASALNSQISAVLFPLNSSDTSQTTALIFYSGDRHHALQAFRFEAGIWQLVAETSEVIGEGALNVGALDVDCDGEYEILLASSTGAAGFRSLEVVKLEGDSLRVITPQGIGNYLVGRYYDFVDNFDDCGKTIELYLDGPVKYEPDRKRIYKLDHISKTYKFHKEEKLESRKTDK